MMLFLNIAPDPISDFFYYAFSNPFWNGIFVVLFFAMLILVGVFALDWLIDYIRKRRKNDAC